MNRLALSIAGWLVVAGADVYTPEEGVMLPFPLHQQTRNAGDHVIYTGGERASELRLPFIPADGDRI